MKQLIRGSILLSVLFNHAIFALDPILGFYGGAFGELSHGPLSYFIVLPPPNTNLVGRVNNSQVGAGGGGVLGYRFSNLRAEGEVFYNWISAGTLAVGDCTLQSPAVGTPTDPFGNCNEDNFFAFKTGFNGSTTSIIGMANVYYDFYTDNSESSIVPYIGVGIGGARIESRINIINTVSPMTMPPSVGAKASASSGALQGIVGASVFIDDYTWFSMDYRYLTTNNINNNGTLIIANSSRYSLQMINFNANFSFDNGTS